MKKTELLAPAGDLEILKSVALSGADAVYFGGELFGARKNARNLTNQKYIIWFVIFYPPIYQTRFAFDIQMLAQCGMLRQEDSNI